MNKKILGVLICLTVLISSCKRTFQYSILEVRPTAENLNVQNINQLSKIAPKDTFSFLFISDTQVSYDQLEDFVLHANKTYPKDSIAFVIHGGDYTDYGANFEYNMYYEDIKKLNFPIIGTIGNHDMLSNGRKIYETMFGHENFSFKYGNNRFIVFNSNGREINFGGVLPDTNWLQNQINQTSEDNIYYLSHVPPTSTDFDPSLIDELTKIIGASSKSRLSMSGHTHSFVFHRPFGDNVDYLIAPTLMKREYVKINVNGNNFNVEKITY